MSSLEVNSEFLTKEQVCLVNEEKSHFVVAGDFVDGCDFLSIASASC